MSQLAFYVDDLDLAISLRTNRLLTSSLRFEPSFKHEEEDPDEFVAVADSRGGRSRTKKQRKVAQFSFEKLLPLRLTDEEALLASEQGRVDFERLSHVCVRCVDADKKGTHGESDEALSRWRSSVQASSRYAVFRALWERGMTLVDGLKFGVDFLAYTSDPTRFHAEHMVLVVRASDVTMTALDAVALVNVAAKANKTLLVASVSSEEPIRKVSFHALRRRPVVLAWKDLRKRARNSHISEEHLLEQVAE